MRYIVTEPAGPTVTLATRATPPVRPRSGVAGGTLVGTAYSSERQSEGKPLGPSSSFADHAPAANAAVGASTVRRAYSNLEGRPYVREFPARAPSGKCGIH